MNIRMSTKGKRPLRSLTPSDKIHAIQRIHDGESKASVARDIGVPESTLRGWCKNEDKLRFMSRQTDKIATDSLVDKLGTSANITGGPPEKRQKVDNGSIPFNYSSKSKYDEIAYKHSPRDGINYSSNKGLTEVGFNGLSTDYTPYNVAVKNKLFGVDITRQVDQTAAAISPLASLSHLTGLSGMPQSPLAINFNELSSNLNLLAQINPGIAAMSGLNGLAATVSTLRTVKTKSQPLLQSPRSDSADRQQGLSVKNWAKQTPSSPTMSGLNLCQTESSNRNQIKCPSPSLSTSMGNRTPPQLPSDDSLLYWLKSQQTIMGLGNVYPPIGSLSPPTRSAPQRLEKLHINSTLNVCTPLTSSTPAFGFDDKHTAWLYWCKALGASLNSLVPGAGTILHSTPMQLQQPQTSNGATTVNIEASISTADVSTQKTHMENILFTQLTKHIEGPSTDNSSILKTTNCKAAEGMHFLNRPEDLSAKKLANSSEPTLPDSSLPIHRMSVSPNTERSLVPTPAHSPRELSITVTPNSPLHEEEMRNNVTCMADCKNVLDNLLYKINNNPSTVSISKTTSSTSFEELDEDEFSGESNVSYISDKHQNSFPYNNTSESRGNRSKEEQINMSEYNQDEVDSEAIKYGEKFLKWLENCSNPRITATHLTQLRFLLSALRPNVNSQDKNSTENIHKAIDIEDVNQLNKVRRRK